MTTQTVTLQIPEDLYARVRQRAERSQRSVEAEFINVLSEAVPGSDELPSGLAEAVASLEQLDDTGLWEVARGRLPDEISAELQDLHSKQQRAGLTGAERQRADELCFEYDRAMLVRARAAALLKERGHNVAGLLGNP